MTFRLMHFEYCSRNQFFEMVRDLNKRKGKNMKYVITSNDWFEMLELQYAIEQIICEKMEMGQRYRNHPQFHEIYKTQLKECKRLGNIYRKIKKQVNK